MIYDLLEQDFLKKTTRFKYNKSIRRIFIVSDCILLIYFGILILLDYLVLVNIIHPLWIGFLIWACFTYYIIIEAYPSKIPLVIPYLVILSIVISIISLYYTVGESYRDEALAIVVCSIIILAMVFLELKILRFIDKKMFNTPEKYDYLLMLLTEIYLKKFKGNYLSLSNED